MRVTSARRNTTSKANYAFDLRTRTKLAWIT
jgi:hypothetical protein